MIRENDNEEDNAVIDGGNNDKCVKDKDCNDFELCKRAETCISAKIPLGHVASSIGQTCFQRIHIY
jgi:hypothetical protein